MPPLGSMLALFLQESSIANYCPAISISMYRYLEADARILLFSGYPMFFRPWCVLSETGVSSLPPRD